MHWYSGERYILSWVILHFVNFQDCRTAFNILSHVWSDCWWVLDWSDLLDSLIQHMTTLYNSHYYTQTHPLSRSLSLSLSLSSVHNQVFTNCCLVAASNGVRSSSSGFPNYPRPQPPASHSKSSWLNLNSSLSHSPTNSVPSNGHCLVVSWSLLSNGSICHNIFLNTQCSSSSCIHFF
jgi:hypothetical protein